MRLAPPPTPRSGHDDGRRDFLRRAIMLAAAPLLAHCEGARLQDDGGAGGDAGGCPTPDVPEEPDRRVFDGYRGLAALPYFELACGGRLRCTLTDLDAIDLHAHLGFCYLSCPVPDYLATTGDPVYLFDFDGQVPPAPVDLDRYANETATEEMLAWMDREILWAASPAWSDVLRTHNVPNLLREMDAMGVRSTVLLPIMMGVSLHDDSPNEYLDAVAACGAPDRLLTFGSVHPDDPDKLTKLRAQAARGIRGLKVHPTMQRSYPDSDGAMELYEECARLGLPVLIHAGRAGVEPAAMQPFAEMRHYEAPARDFPQVQFVFAHAGARLDADACLELARRYPNVWLDLAGPGIPAIQRMLATLGPERLLYATDWPFYPEALTLAKVLIVTEGDATVRRLLLRDNAKRLLGLAG